MMTRYVSLLAFIIFTVNAHGQSSVKCGIWFDYDGIGNRIKRYYDCKSVYDGPIPGPGGGTNQTSEDTTIITMARGANTKSDQIREQSIPTLSPNPTTGPYRIYMKGNVASRHFHVYASSGALLFSGDMVGESYSGSIERFPSGNYIVKFFVGDICYRFNLTKI